jgi:hypothetical protein
MPDFKRILERAEKRRKEIEYDISQLENELTLIKQIIQSSSVEFGEVLEEQMKLYRGLYGDRTKK